MVVAIQIVQKTGTDRVQKGSSRDVFNVWVQGRDSSETIEKRAKHVIKETRMLERHRRNG